VELLRLGICGTGHAGEFFVHAEIVLEGDGGQGLVLVLDDHPFLCLDRLVQAVGPAATRHETAGELVDDHDLALLDHVVNVTAVHGMGAQGLVDMVEHHHVARVVEIVDFKQLLHLEDPLLGEGGGLGLLVDGVVAGVLLPLAGKGIGLDLLDFAFLQLGDDPVDDVVLVRRILRRTGDDQRRPRLVDENGVDLVDNGKIEGALDILLQGELHVVPQVVEAELVVGAVGDVGGIGFAPLVVVQPVNDDADGEAEKLVEPPHPLRVTPCQVVVHRDNMDPPAGKAVQVGGKGGHQGLPFAGFHLGNLAGVEHHAADKLHVEVAHPQDPFARLAADGKGLRQNRLQGLPPGVALAKLHCTAAQFVIGQGRHLRLHGIDFIDNRPETLELPLVLAAEYFLDKISQHVECSPEKYLP